jgi:hypothetical protein
MLEFNNGDVNSRPYSSGVELSPPLQPDGAYAFAGGAVGFGPAEPGWEYRSSPDFFAPIISGAQRLPSGNTLITDGPAGRFFEVNPAGQTVWSHLVTDTAGGTGYLVFRAVRYEAGYAGLAGRTLEEQGPLRIPVPQGGRASVTRY